MNRQRTEALRNYSSVRSYHLELHGLIDKHADMKVKMRYQWPGKKDFTVLSRSGSAFMQKHVFNRLIEAENEASGRSEHQQASITPENYDFELAGYERDDRGAYYILNVTPRFKRKFLFKGSIRVDNQSFAIVRIEGEPATSLSWWTTKVDFVYRYKRVGDFWLPALNETVTHVRIFGRSLLTIKYQDYDFGKTTNATSPARVKLMLGDDASSRALIPPSHLSD